VEQREHRAEPIVKVPPATKRMRRPTGAAPPLPKSIGFTGGLWLALVLVVVVSGCIWLYLDPGPLDRFDAVISRAVVSLRTGWLDSLTRWLNTAGSRGGLAVIGVILVAATAWFGRWRHLVIFLMSLVLLEFTAAGLNVVAQRPRPFDVTAIGPWEGYAAPDAVIVGLALALIGITYMLVVPGRPRMLAKIAVGIALSVAAFITVYLGIDHLTDVLFASIVGVAVPVALFRAFAPNAAYPIHYGKRGKSAHLDVSGRRGDAIRSAMSEQLGLTVLDMKPVGLEGSGGSTPLKMHVVDEGRADRTVFAKLYAKSHVRADRWYKLGRSMLYGRLEDETAFKTVRRFVEYEDYTLRLLGEYGFSTPAALGVVEITPDQEYLIAMEFFDDSVEIGEAEIDEHVIDDGLQLIRRMWDVGLAHRDIKPANLMVQDGRLRLIDVFFVQVRPSPWRQAVDLGNMMLVLALRSDAQTVYDHALQYFTPEELSEAFAATRGVASPTQLRQFLKADGRKLLEEFRAMVPERRPIAIQRWSVRRVALIIVTIVGIVLAVQMGFSLFFPTRGTVLTPECDTGRTMQLMAQAVPSAARVPCVDELPLGWHTANSRIINGQGQFTVGIGEGASHPVTVTLTATCPGESTQPRETRTSTLIEGGCVTLETTIPDDSTERVPSFEPGGGLSFVERSDLVATVEQEEDLTLCGAGAPACP
jgi:tRNA A-37 threonylcarbamoyl transferase component Bud32